MRVFVTGATGYLGSALVRGLLAAGHHPVGLARNKTRTLIPGGASVEWVIGDIRQPHSYEKAAAERVNDIAGAASLAAGARGSVRPWPVAEARAALGPMADALALDQVVRAPRSERVLGFRPKVPAFVPYAPEAFREQMSA